MAALLPVPAHAAEVTFATGSFAFHQRLNDPRKVLGDWQGTYQLRGETADTPLPEGAVDGTYTWTMAGSEDATIPVTYSEPGDYHYTAWQVHPSEAGGAALDDTVWRVTAHVSADGSVVVFVYRRDGSGEKDPDPGWTVTAKPATPEQPTPTPGLPVLVQQALGALPKTGDLTSFGVIALLLLAGGSALVVALRKRRKA